MVNLSFRYGATVLTLKGDKTAIVLKSIAELGPLLTTLRTDVLAGRLDELLAQAAGALKNRFGNADDEGKAA